MASAEVMSRNTQAKGFANIQRLTVGGEINHSLRDRNMPAHKQLEASNAFWWAVETWTDDQWMGTTNLPLDAVIGKLIAEYRRRHYDAD